VQNTSLVQSTATPVNASWSVTCTGASNHNFSSTASVAVDQLHTVDGTTGNNLMASTNATTAISALTDVKVAAASASSPASTPAGLSFTVAGSATLHNNGPVTPVTADTTFTLNLPGDCTTGSTNPVTVQNTSLVQSTATPVNTSWQVTCANSSNHSFSVNASAGIDQLHVTDSTAGNNSMTSVNSNTAVNAQSDPKVTAITTTSPATANGGSAFTVSAAATLHNNGPYGPANVDTTLVLTLPADCTTSSANPAVIQDTALATSAATPANASWSVTCTNPSNHSFSAMATVAIDQLHVADSNTNNNSASDSSDTAITATTDIKVASVTVNSPTTAPQFAPFGVTGSASLHNNGPTGPTTVDTTLTLTLPSDCTTSSTNPVVVQNTSLPTSTATAVPASPATWNVTCTSTGPHSFSAQASAGIDQLHATDPNGANNSAVGGDTTDVTPASITVCKDVIPDDSTVWDFALTGPTAGNVDDLGDGQCAGFDPNAQPGQYTLTESVQAGYAASVDCGANGQQNDNDITFTLDPGEQVTCTFINAFSPGPNPVGGITGLLEDEPGADRTTPSGGNSGLPWWVLSILPAVLTAAVAVKLRGRGLP
jgi:hypothetical protein